MVYIENCHVSNNIRHPKGKYINNKDNLCHKPSNAKNVFLKLGLSPITKHEKHNIANIKHPMQKNENFMSFILYA